MAVSLVRLKPERGGAQVINGINAVVVSAADDATARATAKAVAGGSQVWDDADVWNLDESVLIGNGGSIPLSLSPQTPAAYSNNVGA